MDLSIYFSIYLSFYLSIYIFISIYLSIYLYECLPGVGGDHGLELPGGEGVDVARLGGDQQHHLGPRQGGQLIRLSRQRDR